MLIKKPNTLGFKSAAFGLGLLVAILGLEMFWITLLNYPKLAAIHPVLFSYTRHLYEGFDKEHIQYSPHCAQYDSELFYTLKPGSCSIKEREFEHTYKINSLGVRDDEDSLQAPEIVIVGDSFAMGWGVPQDKNFPSLVEKQTGLKTLNTGIASYGTVRELKMLERIDTSRMKYLIIQYCPNDCGENLTFYEHSTLDISSYHDYLSAQQGLQRDALYYPGKFSWETLKIFWNHSKRLRFIRRIFSRFIPTGLEMSPEEFYEPLRKEEKNCGQLFVYTLSAFQNKWQPDLQIIVLEAELDHDATAEWIIELKLALQDPSLKPPVKNMQVVYTHPYLSNKKHYYILDDHLNEEGHKVIAALLLKTIEKEKV